MYTPKLSNVSFKCLSSFDLKQDKHFYLNSEAATRGVLWKKVFLEISKNSQENTHARVPFLIKLQASGSGTGVWILRNF